MQRSRRSVAALVVGIVGGLGGLLLFGPGVAGCLGPIGVTGVQCAQATGRFPSVEIGGPALALTVLAVALLLRPALLRPPLPAALAAVAGGVAGTLLYLAVRPQTWSGPTSTGEVITLTLPIDVWALLSAAILGVVAGLVGRSAVWRSAQGDDAPRGSIGGPR